MNQYQCECGEWLDMDYLEYDGWESGTNESDTEGVICVSFTKWYHCKQCGKIYEVCCGGHLEDW